MTAPHTTAANTQWTKRWTFILAAAGSAVGLGNIWKFPYIAGENGGGAFIAVYLLCILGIGVPTMIAEAMLGKSGRANPVNAIRKVALNDGKSGAWSWLGALGISTGLLIMMFYSVVAGWALDYVWHSFNGSYLAATASSTQQQFAQLSSNTGLQLGLHSVFILLTAIIIGLGIKKGIGLASELLMPLLALILIILVVYAAKFGDMPKALDFMFSMDFSALSGKAIIVAMGHAFFTLSVGMGAIMTYGAYMPESSCVGRSVITIALVDTVIALLAGLAIFPIVMSHGLNASAGPSLLFESLPLAFGHMPGGQWVGAAFFILITIAALTSAISLLEPAVAWLNQLTGRRGISTAIVATVAWLGGLACIYNNSVFSFLDDTTSHILLPLGGLLTTVLVGWILRRVTVRKRLNTLSMAAFNTWYIAVRFLAPIGIIVIFINLVL